MKQSDKFYAAIDARAAGRPPQRILPYLGPRIRERAARLRRFWQDVRLRTVERIPVPGDKFDDFLISEYGDVEIVRGTGRATCRICGVKIAKGVEAIKFNHDFQGSGSWTAQSIQIHRDPCTPVVPEV